MAQKPTTIFINPKFKNAHINPNFLPNKKIHVNPKFLVQNNSISPLPPPPVQQQPPASSSVIIRNTRRTLIREPRSNNSTIPQVTNKSVPFQQQLIKISNNKLVTAGHLMKQQQKENEMIKNTTKSIIKSKKLQRETESSDSIYKLDRRCQSVKKKRIVKTYSIRRVDAISPQKVMVPESGNRKSLAMVNINGVLYKSTSKKLIRTTSISSNMDPLEQLLFIRGEKFILDSSGKKLKREEDDSRGFKMSRIDIGGLTYKASDNGAFERDNSHQIRSHLSLAKTKSISLLSRSNLKNSNIICPIYRRLGKCLAYANGRCQKKHDQRYVVVCPKFLRDACKNEKCFLSHNANLHKMPVCKYFLQGLCNKTNDCLYLHKKLTDDTKLCAEFLKGYCPLADKCNLLHDFPEPDKKKFSIVRHKTRKYAKKNFEKPAEESHENERYYIDDSSTSTGENVPRRGALGVLPAFIPI